MDQRMLMGWSGEEKGEREYMDIRRKDQRKKRITNGK
jgi:hypothetical protein